LQAVLTRRRIVSEVVALYIADDRWQRAASLPFTREVSRLGGVANFTRQRADQLSREAVIGIERRIKSLAAEADLALAFEELSESNAERLEELARGERSILIAPALITRQPIYPRIVSLGCRIELIETASGSAQA
jgi:DNA-binding transcriptional regulator YhcF (GntR family)